MIAHAIPLLRLRIRTPRLELRVPHPDGEPIGVQSVHGEHFHITRQVATGSWLQMDRHGAGFGTEMRDGSRTASGPVR